MDMSGAVISFPLFGENFKLNPSASFTLFGRTYYWYGLIIAVGVVLALLYMMKVSKRFGFKRENTVDLLLTALIPGIIGARLYYCLFYVNESGVNPYFENPISMLYVWEGGLAIYGGIIFGVIALIVYSKIRKVPIGAVLDLAALAVLIGQCVGRWGNFINREAFGITTDAYGAYIDATVPWRMGLTLDGATYFVHPTFLYESLWNLVGFVILHFISKKRKFDGQVFALYIGWYGLGRMMIEGLRVDSLMIGGSRVSKLLATVLLVGAILFLLYHWLFRKHDPARLYVNRIAAVEAAEVEEVLCAEAEKGEETELTEDNGNDDAAPEIPDEPEETE